MESVELAEKDIEVLNKILVKLGVEVRYDLLGAPDEIIFDLDQLIRYTDFMVNVALDNQEEITKPEE